jgi:tetratricopeptide (TPR) repeat protein
MRGNLYIRMLGALLAGGCVVVAAAPLAAQGSYSPYNETASTALARYVRTLASDPRDFGSLIGAGKAALQLGDPQAAAGFFARADEVNPKSPLPQAGMGAVSAAGGEPQAALPYFKRALQLGAPLVTIACDRGLAYDLLGQQAQAQSDYRAALTGPDAEEARRRLALSLAISGDKAGALAAIAPLGAQDADTGRARAFVLALTGDANGAMAAIDAAMPGSWSRVAPFLQRLPTLAAGQKAAAVNLGIFPDSGDTSYASVAPAPPPPRSGPSTTAVASTVNASRLAGVDALLRPAPSPPPPQPAQQPSWQTNVPVPAAYAPSPQPSSAQRTATIVQQKIWLQLASGPNADALPGQFQRLKSRNSELFEGIRGYVARSPDKARLLIGPFHGASDAQIFAEDLETAGVRAFKWSNSPADEIVPLGTE